MTQQPRNQSFEGWIFCQLWKGPPDVCQSIYEDAFPETERTPLPIIQEECEQGLCRVYLVYNERQEVVAFAIVRLFEGERFVWLSYFAVRADCRSMGVGTYFLQKLFQCLRQEGFARVHLTIESPFVEKIDAATRQMRLRRRKFYQDVAEKGTDKDASADAGHCKYGECRAPFFFPNEINPEDPISGLLIYFNLIDEPVFDSDLIHVVRLVYGRLYSFGDDMLGQFIEGIRLYASI